MANQEVQLTLLLERGAMSDKILVVDDDCLVARAIDMCLTKKGYDVKVFYSGIDVVMHLFCEKPLSMILDIKLPDCSGWFIAGLLRKLDARSQKVPLIITSVLEPDPKRIAEVQPYAYLHKPFHMGKLIQVIEESISGVAIGDVGKGAGS